MKVPLGIKMFAYKMQKTVYNHQKIWYTCSMNRMCNLKRNFVKLVFKTIMTPRDNTKRQYVRNLSGTIPDDKVIATVLNPRSELCRRFVIRIRYFHFVPNIWMLYNLHFHIFWGDLILCTTPNGYLYICTLSTK